MMAVDDNPLLRLIPGTLNPAADVEHEVDDDWASIDLVETARRIRSGEYEPIRPEILDVTGAMPLFYKLRINSLFGESGGGKTWLAIAAGCEVARGGGRVLYIDYEDNANGITERLVLLSQTDDEIARWDYRNPTTGIVTGTEQLALEQLAGYELVIIDSTGEAMAAANVDSNADREVAQWFTVARRLTRLAGGPAVIVLDHVPKDREAPSSYAIGSQRKRAAVTGAAYRVDTIKEPARGRDGKWKLTVAKDRLGNRAKGTVAAIAEMRSMEDEVAIDLHPQQGSGDGERFRPTTLMERISRWLEFHAGMSIRQVQHEVQGNDKAIAEGLQVLVEEGYVTVEPGPRGATKHTSAKPYREYDDPAATPQNDRGPTAAPPRPAAVPKADDRGPAVPFPPRGGTARAAVSRPDENTPEVDPPRPDPINDAEPF